MTEKLLKAIIDLLKVKTIITFCMVFTACHLVISGRLDVTVFVGLVTSVITYYFNKKEDKNG